MSWREIHLEALKEKLQEDHAKTIPLTQGYETVIDAEDYEELSKYKWHASYHPRGYMIAARFRMPMHRQICNCPKNMVVDHINGDTLDNRKCNLRVCTSRENGLNCRKQKGTTSKYKGVSWYRRDKKWRAYVAPHRSQIHLGYFDSENDAARAYNDAAKKHYGEFARLNKIIPTKIETLQDKLDQHDHHEGPEEACNCRALKDELYLLERDKRLQDYTWKQITNQALNTTKL